MAGYWAATMAICRFEPELREVIYWFKAAGGRPPPAAVPARSHGPAMLVAGGRDVVSGAQSGRQSEIDDPRTRQWSQVFQDFVPSIAIVAAAWYAVLTFSYDQFYRRLTVNLNDVGLSYSTILANSVGTALAVALLVAILDLPVLIIWKLRSGRPLFQKDFREFMRPVLVINILCCFLIAIFALPALSSTGFQRVKSGLAVLPPRLPFADFTILPIHADPVMIKPNESKAIQNIATDQTTQDDSTSSRFLYLGQANGTVVIYDSLEQHILYLPSSDVLLSITNCHIREPPKPVCADAKSVVWPFSR
jgi:hypothetical protein